MKENEELIVLSEEIKGTQKILTALGDGGNCSGMRVNDIAEKTSLSRPAVSHHLQILKDAGIAKMRREGTKNYYYFDADLEAFDLLIGMLTHAKAIMQSLPDRSGND